MILRCLWGMLPQLCLDILKTFTKSLNQIPMPRNRLRCQWMGLFMSQRARYDGLTKTMNIAKKVCEYTEAIQLMLDLSQKLNLGFPASTCQEYINKILDLLLIDIEVKAKNYKKPVLACLFILNNAHYILKSVKGTILNDVVDAKTLDRIDKIIKKQLDTYRSRSF